MTGVTSRAHRGWPTQTTGKRRLVTDAHCVLVQVAGEESFGIVMIEKIACGNPVVAVCGGAVPEVVVSGVTGLVCEGARSRGGRDRPGTHR